MGFWGKSTVRQSEVLANLRGAVRSLFRLVQNDELSKVLTLDLREPRESARSARRLSPAEIDQIVDQYRAGGRSVYELSDMFKVHRNTVSLHLKERGVSLRRRPMSPTEIAQAIELHSQGMSGNAIGRVLGRDPKTVRRELLPPQMN